MGSVNVYSVSIWRYYPYSKGGYRRELSSILVEAKDEKEAKIKLTKESEFWGNYFKLPSIEKEKFSNPFKINNVKIEKIKDCKRRNKTNVGKYVCGEIWTNKNNQEKGKYGFCCIDKHHHPFESDDCPYFGHN